MSISMPGMGTGLDIQGMAKQMAKSDLTAKSNQVTKKETEISDEIAALEELDAALNGYYDSLKALSDPETFGTLKVNMAEDDEDFFTVKVDEKAVENSYKVEIGKLASKDKWSAMSAGDIDPDNDLTISTLKKNSKGIPVEPKENVDLVIDIVAGDTLEEIAEKINDDPKNPGLDATVIQGKDGAQLTITSRETGTDNAIKGIQLGSVSISDDSDNNINAATNAELKIDGIDVVSQSNKVEDVVTGVTFNLIKETESPIDVDLSTDTDRMKSSVKAFVENYNTLKGVIDKLSESEPAGAGETVSRPALASDTLITSLNSQLRSAISEKIEGSTFGNLASIGIITKQNGDLEVDSKSLDKALESNPSEVVDLFIGDDAALDRLMESMEMYIGTKESDDDDDDTYKPNKDGLIEKRLDGLKEDEKDVEDEWTVINTRADDLYQRYFNEFNAMDLAVQKMNASMQNLTSLLA